MSSDDRRRQVMSYEGQVLASVTAFGTEQACANARCCIDGAMNALIRIEGAPNAAEFAFALADRVAGGVRMPTAWPAAGLAPAQSCSAGSGPLPGHPRVGGDPVPGGPPTARVFSNPAVVLAAACFLTGWMAGVVTAMVLRS